MSTDRAEKLRDVCCIHYKYDVREQRGGNLKQISERITSILRLSKRPGPIIDRSTLATPKAMCRFELAAFIAWACWAKQVLKSGEKEDRK
jgi:hypothetical protein